MILKQNTSGERTRRYYVCGGKNQEGKRCPGYRISKQDLEGCAFQQIRTRMDNVMKIIESVSSLNISDVINFRNREMVKKSGELTDELKLSQKYFGALYDEYAL